MQPSEAVGSSIDFSESNKSKTIIFGNKVDASWNWEPKGVKLVDNGISLGFVCWQGFLATDWNLSVY